jgi:hypothetical protein
LEVDADFYFLVVCPSLKRKRRAKAIMGDDKGRINAAKLLRACGGCLGASRR